MHKLERVLLPKSIAVFGGRQAASAVAQSIEMGFVGQIWPVHPTKDEIADRKAYRSVADLPGAPAVFVGVNRDRTIDVISALLERGAGRPSAMLPVFSKLEPTTRKAKGCRARW
ncbi:CoA-binding protein [Bradyrhizobium sp. STM 3566]|uniref:CoA-binding protein n=1 Tax=Bradyrhizobium sp. STM 3566 TaxID=578928 RepID=UPI00388CFEE9